MLKSKQKRDVHSVKKKFSKKNFRKLLIRIKLHGTGFTKHATAIGRAHFLQYLTLVSETKTASG